jgi:F-type H+-transporting ATPase subunit delta
MTLRSLARRYATALFDVVKKQGAVDVAARDLAGFHALVAGHAELVKIFGMPTVSAARKRAVVEALLAAGGAVSHDVRRLLLMLADRDRLVLLPGIAEAFAERASAANRVLVAQVTAAMPLNEARRSAVAQALGRATGCQVTVQERVDPSIIGGIIARVGSVVYDASVTRQLAKMRQRLLEEQ